MTSPRERFLEALFESATDYAIIAMDLDGLVISWNEGAHRILGWTEEEMVGLPATVFFTIEDRRLGIPQAEMQAALTKGRGSDERWHERKDGSCFWANGEMMPLRDEYGTVQGFIKILRDRTEQRNVAEARRADAEFLASVLASSGDCIKVLDLDANILFMNEGAMRLMEVDDFRTIQGCPWPDFWAGEDGVAARAAAEAAKVGGAGHFQGQANTLGGTPKWWDTQVTPILDADGRPEKLLAVSRDMTEPKMAEERQRLLMQELAHRVKNTLAVVLGIASQTLRGSGTLPEMREALTSRLLALARAHDVLMQGSWTEASLRALVEGAAALHGHTEPGRLRIDGPDVTLGSQSALSFALVLHELATNAVKYGALSAPEGHVVVRWWEEGIDGELQLRFQWEELDGPAVVPPTRQGFGTRLIERSLAQGLGARVELAYPPTGVIFRFDAPLAGLQQA